MKAKKKRRCRPETAQLGRSWRPYYIAITAIIVYTGFEAYGPALHGPFVYDDIALPYYSLFSPNGHLIEWIKGVRPLLMLSYWMNFLLSGRATYSYHLFNLLCHLANATAVFLIARRILAREVLDGARREILAVFAGTLFLLHPIQTESVAWIAGRSESFSALFFLYALTLFLYRTSDAVGWGRSVGIFVLFACAVASKEHTASLPILLLFTDLWWSPGDRVAAVRRNWRLYLPMLCGSLVAAKIIWGVVSSSISAGFSGAGVNWSSYALTQCRVFFVYLRLFLLPVSQNIDYDMPWSPNLLDFWSLAGLVGIVTLALAAWRLRKQFPVGCYGFFVFLILLAPTSSFIPIKDPIAERRLYLPMLGLVLVTCEFLFHAIRERTRIVAVASLLMVAAAIATNGRNRLWGSEAALWQDTVAKSPNKIRGYSHLVHGLVSEHHCREALQRLDELSRRMSIDPQLLGHWAVAYECVHEPEHALEKLEQAALLSPTALIYLQIARNQLALNRAQDALGSLNRALELDATLEPAYIERGELRERQGDRSGAAMDYARVLQLNSSNEQARQLLRLVSNYKAIQAR
jgi:hypothetical protein